jgi:hypothetical protein
MRSPGVELWPVAGGDEMNSKSHANAIQTAPAGSRLPAPDAALDRAGRVAFYHGLACSAARVSVMAAIAAGVELHRAKAEA